jgi:hypothetical protein
LVSIEVIWSTLEKASSRLAQSIGAADLEAIARPTWFVMDLRRDSRPPFESRLPRVKVDLDLKSASSLAAEIRLLVERDDLTPLFDLPKIVEEDLEIEIGTINHPFIAGCSATFERHQFMQISRNDEINSLYMCARQLGHLLLQNMVGSTAAATIELMHERSHAPLGVYKRFADCFALDLLIPTRALGIALQEVRSILKVKNKALGDVELLYMARIFNVGFFAMARRCERVGLLPKGGANILNAIITEKYGNPEARANDLGLPDRIAVEIPVLPRSILRKMKSIAARSGNYIDEVALQLHTTPSDVERMLELA